MRLANDTVSLAFGNRAKDWTWATDYTWQGYNAVGFSLSFDLPIHDRNQGEIARSQAAVRQAAETEASTQVGVETDVVNAYYGLQTSEQIVSLYESGYLDQATQSRDITTYAFGRGAATVLDVLDAERSYRSTQLGYRQAIAAYMIAAEQVNQAVGAQVIPMRLQEGGCWVGCLASSIVVLAASSCALKSNRRPCRPTRRRRRARRYFRCRKNQMAQLRIVDVKKRSGLPPCAPLERWIGTPTTPRRQSRRSTGPFRAFWWTPAR